MRYADLWRAMKRYNYESDAWQEFVGAIGEQTDGRWPNEVAAAEAPEVFARHWVAVAAGERLSSLALFTLTCSRKIRFM
jgi:hypothetical protein